MESVPAGGAVPDEGAGVGALRQLLDARDAQLGLLRLPRRVLGPVDAHLPRAEHEAAPAVQAVPAAGTRRAPRREVAARARLPAWQEKTGLLADGGLVHAQLTFDTANASNGTTLFNAAETCTNSAASSGEISQESP